MRSSELSFTALLLAAVGVAAAADKPYPIFTPENFTNNMQLLGRNVGGMNASLAKSDFETAKAQLARSRELLAITVTFWRDRQKEDAVKILRDTLNKMDDLDTALSAEKVDSMAVNAISKQIGAGCQGCHSTYREQDPSAGAYRFNKSLVQ